MKGNRNKTRGGAGMALTATLLLSLMSALLTASMPADATLQTDPGGITANSLAGISTTRADWADQSLYTSLGLNIADPEAFDSTDTGDPMEDYQTIEVNQLYLASMNQSNYNTQKFDGTQEILESVKSISATQILNQNDFDVDKMPLLAGTKFPRVSSDDDKQKKAFEYQMHDAVGADLNGDGTDEMFYTTFYTGTTGTGTSDRRSMQKLAYATVAGKTLQEDTRKPWYVALTDAGSDDKTAIDSVEQDSSECFTAITSGDYNRDGKDEVAVYIPGMGKNNPKPHILILRVDTATGAMTALDRIYIKDIATSWDILIDEWYVPIVNLATTSISGRDDLVVNVSMPRRNSKPYNTKGMRQGMWGVVYHWTGSAFDNVYSTHLDDGTGAVGRFSAACDTDLNGNGTKELLFAAYRNTEKDNDKGKVGKIDGSNNLVELVCWDSNSEKYIRVWQYAKKVPAHEKLSTSREMLEPVALASGKLRVEADAWDVFLEGVLLRASNYKTLPADGHSEADCFVNATISQTATMDLHGTNSAFVMKAQAGYFSRNYSGGGVGAMQLIVIAGDHPVNADKINYDVTWIWEKDGKYVTNITNNDYVGGDEDDYGTLISIAAVNAKPESLKFKYKGKTVGWSKPRPIAVMYATPYWQELTYEDQSYGKGVNEIRFTSSTTRGTTGEWQLGISANLGVEGKVGEGPKCLASISQSAGIEVGAAAAYTGSYMTKKSKTTSLILEGGATHDMVAVMATPIVKYQYDLWYPGGPVTQAAYDEYKTSMGEEPPFSVGDEVEAGWYPIYICATYNPSFSQITREEYNEVAEATEGMETIPDSAFPHTIGDPSSYPHSTDAITSVAEKSSISTAPAQSMLIREGEATTSMELAQEKGNELSNGFKLDADGGFQLGFGVQGGIPLVANVEVQSEVQVKLFAGGGAGWQTGSSEGVAFCGRVSALDAGYNGRYNYAVKMGYWNSNIAVPDLDDEDTSHADNINSFSKDGLVLIGYFVTGTDSSTAPPSLPYRMRVGNRTADSITLAWETPAIRVPSGYIIQVPNNMGVWVDYATLPGSAKGFVDDGGGQGLLPGTGYSYRIVSLDAQGNRTAPSSVLKAYTYDTESGPQITTQPVSAALGADGKATFTVVAEAAPAGSALSYQWYRWLPEDETTAAKWTPVAGGTAATLKFLPTVKEVGEAWYAVMIKQNVNGRILAINSDEVQVLDAAGDPEEPPSQPAPTFAALSYEISYAANGAALPAAADANPTVVTPHSAAFTLNAPTKRGAIFAGWYFDAALTQPVADNSIDPAALEGDITLYAKWQTSVFTIDYVLNGGINAETNPDSYTLADGLIDLAAPMRLGYSFTGWFTDAGLTAAVEHIDGGDLENVTLYAGWQIINYHIFYALGGGTNNPDNPKTYTVNDAVAFTAPNYDGHDFLGWYGDYAREHTIKGIPAGSTGYRLAFAHWREPAIEDEATPVVYTVIEHFGTFKGSGTATAKVDADHTNFQRLLLGNAEIDASHYTVTQGSTVIALKESYLKTLHQGTHVFTAEFSDGASAGIRLVVDVENGKSSGTNDGDKGGKGSGKSVNGDKSAPQTGDDSNIPLWRGAALVTLGLLCLLIWRRSKMKDTK